MQGDGSVQSDAWIDGIHEPLLLVWLDGEDGKPEIEW